MQTDTIEIRRLTPSAGKYLTNGETVAEGAVYLGKTDDAANWREITAAEKAAWEAEQQAKAEADAQAAAAADTP